MRRIFALLAGAAAGTAAGALLRGRLRPQAHDLPHGGATAAPDPRAEDLRRKLAEARASAADEDDFEAAGMGPETLVEDETDVDATRRRVHDEARAAADEMRRAGEDDGA